MSQKPLMSALRGSVVATALVIGSAPFVQAQGAGDGFLFGAPTGSLTIRGGWAVASARSDLFSFTTEQLTLKRGDFSSPSGDVDLAFFVNPRTQIVASASVASRSKSSEFRNYIDNNDLPIEQTTSFLRVPVTIGVKRYLTPTGRSIGKFAWIPARVAPYVGGGVGAMYYRFRQSGDFIDFKTLDVFSSLFASDGWTPTAHGQAGIDYSLNPRFALTGEARYIWSKASLSHDFSGFENLDLSGFSTTVGLAVRF
jgi:outer membrane protein W